MAYLIILRGPAGSGKSSVCKYLKSRLRNACSLDLDITGPDEDIFDKNVTSCLNYDYVIGMMFYGNSHTDHPQEWIGKFKARKFKILSVILKASKDECYQRCRDDPCPQRIHENRQEKRCNEYWDDFYRRENMNPFYKVAEVEEITIETKSKPYQQVGDEILGYLHIPFE